MEIFYAEFYVSKIKNIENRGKFNLRPFVNYVCRCASFKKLTNGRKYFVKSSHCKFRENLTNC
jgi:hypothetical protein